MKLLIEARGPAREPVGIVEGWTYAKAIPRHNNVGTWTLKIPGRALKAEIREAWLARGASGVRIVDQDQPTAPVILSGPITSDVDTWGADDPHEGSISVSGISDMHVLSDRLTYPNPAAAWTSQTTTATYRYPSSGKAPAETVLRSLINVNTGPAALAARQVPGLTLEADAGRGLDIRTTTRFEPLLELCQRLAAAGQIGFKVDQAPAGGLVVGFYVPTLRADVLLSPDTGTVTAGTATVEAPTVTRALVAGSGTGTARALRERVALDAEAEWGRRIEVLVDRRESGDGDDLDQAGDEALAEGAARGSYLGTIQDGFGAAFGVDYGLGDRIAYSWRGVEFTDVVREVEIEAQGGRTTVRPVVGTEDASATPKLYKRVARAERILRRLLGAP
jgi:hypothetical protein